MLFSNFSDPISLIIRVLAVVICLSFHEMSHAFVAYRLGDPTAANQGRLSLNPLKHLDVIGTLMLFISGFGWARPVPVNPVYFKNRKGGMMLVSLAGPLSNIFLAFIIAFPYFYMGAQGVSESNYGFQFMSILFSMNLGLAVFNLIPVPPLDGSKILSGILPPGQYFKFMQYENYIGIVFLLIILIRPGILDFILGPIVKLIAVGILNVVSPIINMLL